MHRFERSESMAPYHLAASGRSHPGCEMILVGHLPENHLKIRAEPDEARGVADDGRPEHATLGWMMSLITATNLAKSYGGETVFSGVSLQIPKDARIALVGANGIGKTTLLRLMAGHEAPSHGQLQCARGMSFGYLPQEAAFNAEHTLWEECLQAFDALLEKERELAAVEVQVSAADDPESILARYGQLQEAFEHAGGYTYETSIRQSLTGLGFAEADFHTPLPHLSGGQRTRALLARLLLANPDLLILDEPTNHLDIAAVEWLEAYLGKWAGAVLIVSHDRYFLDRVVDHIWEMRRDGLETFRGNYSAYAHQREERWEQRRIYVETEKARLERELEFVRKHLSDGLTNQAKGKLRRASRIIRAIETHGFDGVKGKRWLEIGTAERPMRIDEAWRRLKALGGRDHRERRIVLRLQSGQRSGEKVLRGQELLIGYPGNALFAVPQILLQRRECAALIGPNGSGKTTFLRTLLGQMPPLEGEMRPGASLKIGYFAQAHEELDPALTLMEEIARAAPQMLPGEIRSYLGRFLFSGDDHYKRVSILSGGERGRLALAKLALSDANFLLLDEPTNHLDIPSQEVLQEMLAQFEGTILLVTHDRYLIDALATQIWEIVPGECALRLFEGSYSEYRAELTKGAAAPTLAPRSDTRPVKPAGKAQQRQHRVRVAKLEGRIAELEARLAATAAKLADPPGDTEIAQRLAEFYVRIETDLTAALSEWEELQT